MDKARRKLSLKRGAERQRLEVDTAQLSAPILDEQLLEVDEALDQLAMEDPYAADLVKLRFFAGFEHREAVQMLGLSRTAADLPTERGFAPGRGSPKELKQVEGQFALLCVPLRPFA